MGGLHIQSNILAPVLELFHAGLGPLLAVRVHVIGRSVLRLVRLDGWVEDVRSVLDLEVEGVV